MLRFVAAITVLTALAACETTKGVGRDVEDAGEAIQDAAT
ncbi:entericidin A/B family lipoprotein [Roseobacter sp. A03A-229]